MSLYKIHGLLNPPRQGQTGQDLVDNKYFRQQKHQNISGCFPISSSVKS